MTSKEYDNDSEEDVTGLDDLLYSLEKPEDPESPRPQIRKRKESKSWFWKNVSKNKIYPSIANDKMSKISMQPYIPFWVISISRFLELYENGDRKLERHKILKERGDLVNLQNKPHRTVIFVSHEWASYRHPDPSGTLIHVLCKSLRCMLKKKNEYFDLPMNMRLAQKFFSTHNLCQDQRKWNLDPNNTYLWFDFISMPQPQSVKDKSKMKTKVVSKNAVKEEDKLEIKNSTCSKSRKTEPPDNKKSAKNTTNPDDKSNKTASSIEDQYRAQEIAAQSLNLYIEWSDIMLVMAPQMPEDSALKHRKRRIPSYSMFLFEGCVLLFSFFLFFV